MKSDIPTIDKVIMCSECKYRARSNKKENSRIYCVILKRYFPRTFYCKYGKKSEVINND